MLIGAKKRGIFGGHPYRIGPFLNLPYGQLRGFGAIVIPFRASNTFYGSKLHICSNCILVHITFFSRRDETERSSLFFPVGYRADIIFSHRQPDLSGSAALWSFAKCQTEAFQLFLLLFFFDKGGGIHQPGALEDNNKTKGQNIII